MCDGTLNGFTTFMIQTLVQPSSVSHFFGVLITVIHQRTNRNLLLLQSEECFLFYKGFSSVQFLDVVAGSVCSSGESGQEATSVCLM